MGLDMYLYEREYVKNWDYFPSEEKILITMQVGNNPPNTINPTYLLTEVAYWRKANAIHKWFVDNVQDGKDDCGYYPVDIENLKELMSVVEQVLSCSVITEGKVYNGTKVTNGKTEHLYEDGRLIVNDVVASTILPTEEGFFFGSTDYDEYYIQDLEKTKELLTKIIDNYDEDKFIDYIYHSSW